MYATDLFDDSTIRRMATHFCTLLAAAVAAPDMPAAALPLADAAELHLTLRTFNDTEQPYPSDKAVHQLFEQQAGCQPQAACLVTSSGERLSYAAVNAASNQLAHWLVSRGLRAGTAVGVSLPKCPQLYIALLAVLKAGGAYVPLDPELPAERAAFMLQQAGARLLLAAAAAGTVRLPGVEAVIVDQGWQQFADQPETNPSAPRRASRRCLLHLYLRLDRPAQGLLSVFFCSISVVSCFQSVWRVGCCSSMLLSLQYISTTQHALTRLHLQGVEVCHGGVTNLLHYYRTATTPLGPGSMFFQTMPVIFDGSVMDIWLPLSMGCGIVVAPADDTKNPNIARQLIEQHHVVFLMITPSHFQVWRHNS